MLDNDPLPLVGGEGHGASRVSPRGAPSHRGRQTTLKSGNSRNAGLLKFSAGGYTGQEQARRLITSGVRPYRTRNATSSDRQRDSKRYGSAIITTCPR